MSVSDELERLQALRDQGALSEAEFAQAKARVLGGAPGSAGDGSTGAVPPPHQSFLHRLARSKSDCVLGGVCGGLGKHTGVPSWAWRVIFCASAFYMGFGILFYIALWIFIPAEQG
jgi:phage shock protein PspC (stress-responsive transcriptional regulator)